MTPGVMMQVSEIMGDNDFESTGKKRREERETMLVAQAENDKLLDKDWREGTFVCDVC
jgi:hypothetical protein